jgi:light-regulated signal transduction histidine kinase (bacteriophytochrome)
MTGVEGQGAAMGRPHAGNQRIKYPRARTRAAIEAELVRLSARVEELERERAHFKELTAMAAHELLKPLVMNAAYAKLVSERAGHALDVGSRRDLDAIVRISSGVRLLVERLLADAYGGGRPLNREWVDLSAVVGDCLQMLEPEMATRSARLHIDPMPVIEGDAALLKGVFSNLLSNALKYGPTSGGDVHVSVERSEAGWTFAVQSAGPAISEQARERIFDAWERGEDEGRTTGAGLGLAVVRRIVERHGGHVGVTSPSESANTFFFTLPA